MAGRDTVATAGTSTAATFESYLAALEARLPGPRRRRDAVLAEILDGLHEAAAQGRARGLPPADAAHVAVAEFGSPSLVAEAFAGELATAHARRIVTAFLATGPIVGLWWLLLLAPRPWPPNPAALWTAIPVLPLVAAISLVAVGVLATTGTLTRWLPETTPARALTATTAVGSACFAADLALLALLANHALAVPGTLPAALAVAAAAASGVRLGYAARTVHRCLHTRGTLQAPR